MYRSSSNPFSVLRTIFQPIKPFFWPSVPFSDPFHTEVQGDGAASQSSGIVINLQSDRALTIFPNITLLHNLESRAQAIRGPGNHEKTGEKYEGMSND